MLGHPTRESVFKDFFSKCNQIRRKLKKNFVQCVKTLSFKITTSIKKHYKNWKKIHKITPIIFIKVTHLILKPCWTMQKKPVLCTCFFEEEHRGEFRTQSNIYDEALLQKLFTAFSPNLFSHKKLFVDFDWVLNTPLESI